jgi:thioredoxin-like negative regulator of GroEL
VRALQRARLSCSVLTSRATQYEAADFLKVDVDEMRAISSRCGVRAMPTFHFMRDGKLLSETKGADARAIEEAIVKHMPR